MLVELVSSRNLTVWKPAAELLARLGPAAVAPMAALTGHHDREMRYHAVRVLGNLAPDSAPAVGRLAEALSDHDEVVAAVIVNQNSVAVGECHRYVPTGGTARNGRIDFLPHGRI